MLVPRRNPRREQAIRASRLTALGVADTVDEGVPAEEVDWLLGRDRLLPPGALAAAGIRLDGAERAAAAVIELARATGRRPGPPGPRSRCRGTPWEARRDAHDPAAPAVRLAVPAGTRGGRRAHPGRGRPQPGPALAAALGRGRGAAARRNPPTHPQLILAVSALSLVALVLLAGVADYWATRLLAAAGLHVANDLRLSVLARLQRQSLRFHGKHRVGDLTARVTSDVAYTQDMLVQVLATLLPASVAGDRHVRGDA